MTKILINSAERPLANFVFAHGAGAGKDHEFMQSVALGLAKRQINVLRFDFDYMQLAQQLGKRRPPDKMDKLQNQFKAVLTELDSNLPVVIGGKSMGGRVASLILDDTNACACICMGYPFHPPGKPEKLRTAHLSEVSRPMLILQGERDTFGTQQEIAHYDLDAKIQIKYLTDGDHSFKPRKASGLSLAENIELAIEQSAQFIQKVCQD
ncbi:alpha/beta family hydrolase [Paraglaciecola aestuariivivens]